MVQFWKNGIMMSVVTQEQAQAIMTNCREAGFFVQDNGHYFVVDTEPRKEKKVTCPYCGKRANKDKLLVLKGNGIRYICNKCHNASSANGWGIKEV